MKERKEYWGTKGAATFIMAADTCKFLIEKRSEEVNEPCTFAMIGGRIEENETYMDGAKREFFEETGHKIDNIVPLNLYVDNNFSFQNFLGIVPNEFKPKLSWESESMQWMSLNQIQQLKNKHFGLERVLIQDGKTIKRLERNCKIANRIS